MSGTGHPLVASYSVVVTKPGNVSIEYGPDTSYGLVTSQQHADGTHAASILVGGMRANTTYHMRAHLHFDDGTDVIDGDHTFTTGSIPAGLLPNVTATATNGLTPQPGVPRSMARAAPTAFATDLQGNVIWYSPFADRSSSFLYPIKLLPNWHFTGIVFPVSSLPGVPLAPKSQRDLREFNLAGNTIRHLSMDDLNARLAAKNFNITLQNFSHDFALLPNGHILVIANTIRNFTDLPGYPGTLAVLGDVVVDLDPDFNPVWLWNMFDHLDVNRHPMGFPDWTHANSLTYSPDDGNFLISIRHQN